MRGSSLYQRMDEAGRLRLNALIPELVVAAAAQDRPLPALEGGLQVVEAIGRRSAYFSLLNENPAALDRLLRLCGLSDFLVRQLAAHPLLLDELLDPRIFADPPGLEALREDLDERLRAIGDDDAERRCSLRSATSSRRRSSAWRWRI